MPSAQKRRQQQRQQQQQAQGRQDHLEEQMDAAEIRARQAEGGQAGGDVPAHPGELPPPGNEPPPSQQQAAAPRASRR